MLLVLCMLSNVDWYLYEVSWRQLERFSSYRADTILWQSSTWEITKVGKKPVNMSIDRAGG